MPEMTEVQDDLQVTMPDVPIREGEERYTGALLLDQAGRKESLVAGLRELMKDKELRALLTADGQVTSAEAIRLNAAGKAATRRRKDFQRTIATLMAQTHKIDDHFEGPAAPATVINCNPEPLSLQGELQRWSIPAAGQGQTIELKFKGRTFVGSYITISTPHVWSSCVGTEEDKSGGGVVPSSSIRHIPCIGIAHQFYDHFVEGASDAKNLGGVIVFAGEPHVLESGWQKRNRNRVWVPVKKRIEDDVVYVTEPHPLLEVIERALMIQRQYAEMVITEAHGYATSNSDIVRNQLSGYHRTWHNFALKMGYIEKPYDWAVKKLQDAPNVQAVFCPNCLNRQTSPEQFFCNNCNSAFDPLKAFLAGRNVPLSDLHQYEGEEWETILAEAKRRKAKVAMLELEPEPATKKGKA